MITSSNQKKFIDDYLKKAQVYTICVPKNQAWEPQRAAMLLQHLLTQFRRLTFGIAGEQDHIDWQILDLWHGPRTVPLLTQSIQSINPEAHVEVTPCHQPVFREPFYRYIIPYRQANDFVAPIMLVHDAKPGDPLIPLVNGMRDLQQGERVTHMLHVMGAISAAQLQAAYKRITVSPIHPLQFLSAEGAGRAIGIMLSGNPRLPRYQDRLQHILENRLRPGKLYYAFLTTQLDVLNRSSLARISNLASSVLHCASDSNTLLPVHNGGGTVVRVNNAEEAYATSAIGRMGTWFEGTDQSFLDILAVLSVEELATLWHLPHAGFTAPEISYLPSGEVPLPAILARNTEGICLGTGRFQGKQTVVRILDSDRRYHISITGKTGQGKSTLIHAMIHQDIQDGKNVIVITPHPNLISDLLQISVPDRRIPEVLVLDLDNKTHPAPLNPFILPGENKIVAAGQVVTLLKKVYDIEAPRTEDAMLAALLTLTAENTPTARDVVRLFINGAYRHQLLARVQDVVTQEFWMEFERMTPSVQREFITPILHRMRHFYRNPVLYPILCHPNALDFADLIRQKKIILVSLGSDERQVPSPDRQFIGANLVSLVQVAIMQNLNNVTPSFHYYDEIQHLDTKSLEQMLNEARKFGAHLCLVNQFLGQLKGGLQESVIGNVGVNIVFKSGVHDGKIYEPYFFPQFSAEDLMNLHPYHAAVKMGHAGQTLPAFTLHTVAPSQPLDIEQAKAREAMIRQQSISRYTPKTRQEVLAWLEERYRPPQTDTRLNEETDVDSFDWSIPEQE